MYDHNDNKEPDPMKLSDYQLFAAATAQPKAYDLEYLVPMIVGEVGELFGQKAKSHWHGWDAAKLELELVSEYGDIAWGTAILLHKAGIDDIDPDALAQHQTYDSSPLQQLLSRSHYMHMFYTAPGYQANREDWITQEAKMLWLALERHSRNITGVSFEAVLKTNLAKLAGRVSRGTLLGQGDHR